MVNVFFLMFFMYDLNDSLIVNSFFPCALPGFVMNKLWYKSCKSRLKIETRGRPMTCLA